MSERILIGVAWPYANGPLHLGHIAGCYLPADIFARYHRTKGNQVLMVSGSDQHGTPITVTAERQGRTPEDVVAEYHQSFLDSWAGLGISFDLFTRTGTENHARVVHEIFLRLLDQGDIFKDSMPLLFCPRDQRFLPDRYVEGTCPFCGFTRARGDQCDNCGRPLNALELVEPRCVFCGTAPEIRESEHFFLRLSAFNERLKQWVRGQTHWRPNVYNFTLRYLEEGLRDRAITRDIEWGVPIPLPGYERKRIYVWFEAVIGYLSASKEWAERRGQPDAWEPFWKDPATRSYYFIGKDNIVFHTVVWPAELMGYGGLNLPYDVPANEFLTLEGQQLSTSRNWAVWVPDYLAKYDPDPLRYLMSINMPETADTDFSWRELVRRNNEELVSWYGNLVHRVLTFTYRNFEGRVPTPGPLDPADHALEERAKETLGRVGDALERTSFREAIRAAMELARDANRYLDEKAPWKTLREDRERTATTLYMALAIINCLKKVLYPFLPFSSERLQGFLGLEGSVQAEGWTWTALESGQPLQQPQPLFTKLDESIIEEETARLGHPPI
ncbi:MAG: methionine--tRNA ligase [Chloroflexi bacterium]|nr:methionine--tRNA ligase [Chloroflexota bacterium]